MCAVDGARGLLRASGMVNFRLQNLDKVAAQLRRRGIAVGWGRGP